ncbi:pickpocket protein 28-like isoform X2 [Osmia bicornis bicornis]|uniref:pickpocket protein 28-like isoform X2 n=1 Tax=Osmia bicornis bicornis TaxID=1437191 RepID=UPI001EAF41FF|nr:pickpocket protein 28-like isoform X2 [Osmia bicornis bicornis]
MGDNRSIRAAKKFRSSETSCFHVTNLISKKGLDINVSKKLFSSLMKLIRPDKLTIDNATASWALDILGYSVEKLMFELMQPCSMLVVRCSWLGQLYDCNKIFKTVKSPEGFCCGFNYHFKLSNNYRDENAWLTNITTVEEDSNGYNSSDSLPGIGQILHVPGTGRDVGLAVALNIDAENYRSSVRQFVGASVLIHDPLDYPDVGTQSITLQPSHVMSITLSGTKIHSSKNIQKVPLRKRRCLFDDEGPGGRQYSYQTCISECMQRVMYGFCDCLPFFYPIEHPNERTCYLTDVDCILSRRRNLSQTQLSYINECNCFPECTDTSYEVISESIQIHDLMYSSELTHDLDIKKTSYLYIYFRDSTYIEYHRLPIQGWDNLLASFGGIFGLCLGGSVISFVEFFYYMLTNFITRARKQEQGNENIPPASKLFISVPANVDRKTYNATLNKNAILTWDQQFSQQNQKNTIDLKTSTFCQ